MRHRVFSVIILAAVLMTAVSGNAGAADKVALVIGNGGYKFAPLPNPVNDATDMAAMLKKIGFQVIALTDADRNRMLDGIGTFSALLKNGSVGLFFYAGHGVQISGDNYLLPVDALLTNSKDAETQCVKAQSVLRAMESANRGLNIIIMDACRNDPFGRKFRGAFRGGLAEMTPPVGSLLAYATSPDMTASDGPGRNGLYTSALLKHLPTPGLRLTDLFIQVRNEVVEKSHSRQVPWEHNSLRGAYCLVSGGSAALNEPPIPPSVSAPVIEAPADDEFSRDSQSVWVRGDRGKYCIGDRIRISYGSNNTGYIYLFLVEPDGRTSMLLKEAVEGGKNYEVAGETTPPDGRHMFVAVFNTTGNLSEKDIVLPKPKDMNLRGVKILKKSPSQHAAWYFDIKR